MNHEIIGIVAGSLAFLQLIPYLISIFRRETRPERATYAIWSLVNIVIVSSYIAAGATTTIWVGAAYAASQMVVFLLSFKYGVGGLNRFDIICMLLALVGVYIWVSTANPIIALYFFVFVKALGLAPTLRKVYYLPRTENKLSWSMCATASILNIFALTSLAPNIAVLPIYALLGDGAIAFLVLFPKLRPRSKSYRRAISSYARATA